jgi:hypothetical protein
MEETAEAAPIETPREVEAVAEQTVPTEAAEKSVEPEAAKTTTRVLRPTGTQFKQLTLTKDALKAGFKPGERVVSEAQTKAAN